MEHKWIVGLLLATSRVLAQNTIDSELIRPGAPAKPTTRNAEKSTKWSFDPDKQDRIYNSNDSMVLITLGAVDSYIAVEAVLFRHNMLRGSLVRYEEVPSFSARKISVGDEYKWQFVSNDFANLLDSSGVIYYLNTTISVSKAGVQHDKFITSPAFGVSENGPNYEEFGVKAREALKVDDSLEDFLLESENTLSDSTGSDNTASPTSANIDKNPTAPASGEDANGNGSELQSNPQQGQYNGEGLSPGAIAGIVVGTFILLVAIIGTVWLLHRRKKAVAPLLGEPPKPLIDAYPTGGGSGGGRGHSNDFAGEKEATIPNKEPLRPGHHDDLFIMAGAAGTGTDTTNRGSTYVEGGNKHQHYTSPQNLAAAVTAREAPLSSAHHGSVNSTAPSMTVVRHLMDPDMTEEEVRRLEDEERELDRQIAEAVGRRQ